MKEKNKVFFGDHGITATSANHLANLAKEEATADVEELNAANFITVLVKQVGSSIAPDVITEGKDEDYVNGLQKRILHCAAMNSFIAWMREAIKAKLEEEDYWTKYNVYSYIADKNIQVPKHESLTLPTEDDVIADMNIKEREEYLALEATAAAYGSNIHLMGPINKARKELHRGLAHPCRIEDRVNSTVIFNNQASAKPELVDKVFEELQDQHRSIEQRLNSIKAKIKEELAKRTLQVQQTNLERMREVDAKMRELQSQCAIYVQARLEEVRNLKIVIPDKLKTTYEYLNAKGKKSE